MQHQHQYDAMPALSEIVVQFVPKLCLMMDVHKRYADHCDPFVAKLVHELLFA